MLEKYSKNILVALLIVSALVTSSNFYYMYKYPINYNDIIVEQSHINDINSDFVCAVIAEESRFQVDALSSAGAMGLMQLIPSTAIAMAELVPVENFEIEQLYDPDINIILGTKYLRYLLDKFSEVRTVLAAYNAGEGKVMNWLINSDYSDDGITIKTTPYKETNAYIDKVINTYKIYRNKSR